MFFTTYNIAYILSQVLGVFAVYKFMKAFFEKRRVKKSTAVIAYVGFYVIPALVYLFINIPIINFIVTLLSYFLLTFLYFSPIKKRIYISLMVFVFGICTEMFVVILTGYINFPINETNNYNSIFGIVALNVLFFVVSMICGLFKNIKKDNILPKSFWALFLIEPILSLFVLSMFFQSKDLSSYEISFSVAAILMMNFTVFFLFDRISKLYKEKQESAFIKQQNEYYVNQLTAVEELYRTSREARHSIKNHLLTILSYMEKNDNCEAKKYITDIVGSYQNKAEIIHTGYPEIDGLVNFKFHSAIENGTKININVSIPSGLSFPSFDLTEILGNLIDNALEAVAFVAENPFIDFRINCSKGLMIIKISNPYKIAVNIENGKIVTSKENPGNHGIGLKSVKEALNKYNGITKIETNENIFTITAALYLNQI